MKLLHVIPDLAPAAGGPVTAVRGMAFAQAALGHSVIIATSDYSLEKAPYLDNVKVVSFRCSFSPWRLSFQLGSALPALVGDSDMVHIHTMWEYPTWAAANSCRKLGKPYILRPCGMLDKWSLAQSALKKKVYLRLLAATFIHHAAAIHYTSEGERTHALSSGNNQKDFVCPIGLPQSAYINFPQPQAFFKKFPEMKGKRLVLFLGRLHYKKQPDIVIRSFHELCAVYPDIHLVMAGQGAADYVMALRHLVNKLNMQDKVTFTGMLLGEAKREAYAAAELFVLPSLQENFGIAVAEAMAGDCPVVVSNKVDLSPAIADAKAGLVCSPEVGHIATAMCQILEDADLREQMSKNGRGLIMEKYTWEKIVGDLTEIYEDILSGRHENSAWNN